MGLKIENSYSYDNNVYSNPEKHKLKIVAELEYSSGSYEFDTRVVWQGEDGRLWTARDSGCSCPTPFEGTEELDRCFIKDLEGEYQKHLKDTNDYNRGYPSVADWQEFIAKVRAAKR
jgi:hypothetical protein